MQSGGGTRRGRAKEEGGDSVSPPAAIFRLTNVDEPIGDVVALRRAAPRKGERHDRRLDLLVLVRQEAQVLTEGALLGREAVRARGEGQRKGRLRRRRRGSCGGL